MSLNYPRPLVDHKQARLETLAALKAASKSLTHGQARVLTRRA